MHLRLWHELEASASSSCHREESARYRGADALYLNEIAGVCFEFVPQIWVVVLAAPERGPSPPVPQLLI